MNNTNIYDGLYTIYLNHKPKEYNTYLDKFENDIELILSDDFELCNNTIKKFYDIINQSNKKSFIDGFKFALELLK